MKKTEKKQREIKEDCPNRASYYHGSTTQGGSNFGQGSYQLGRNANKQGSESNTGANYDNEKDFNTNP